MPRILHKLVLTVLGLILLSTFGYQWPPQAGFAADDLVTRKPLPRFIRNPTVADRYLGTRDVQELLQFARVEPVCIQLLKRNGIPDFARIEAITRLAELRETDPVAELLPWIRKFDRPAAGDQSGRSTVAELAGLLPQQTAGDLKRHREPVKSLALTGRHDAVRQAAIAAWIAADQSADEVWSQAAESTQVRLDLLRAVPLLTAEFPRATLYERVKPLMYDSSNSAVQSAAIEAMALLDGNGRETFDTLSDLLLQGVHPDACVRGICNISSDQWTGDRRKPLADGLLRRLAETELDARTSKDAKDTIKLIKALASLLPSEDEFQVRARLDRLSVQVIRITTLEEQMAYDQTVMVLRAGQGVQIVFRNGDIMPHNLVIVDSPAAREDVGIAADRMQNDSDAISKGYLPDSDQILHATRLLQPGQSDTLSFVAPAKSGTYAYVCTFPGHWSKMYGAIVVVDDVQAFMAANRPLPNADDLLGIRTVEWTYDQLATNLSGLHQGRSYENGQRMFLKASCFSCHKVGDEGGRIGPELTRISEQYKSPAEVLKHVMDPSAKVDEKYATVVIETGDGEVLRGVIVSDTETTLAIKADPLASCEPTIIEKDNIEDLSRSSQSPMPQKLLNTIVEQSDVYDLLAYLISGGDPRHELFGK